MRQDIQPIERAELSEYNAWVLYNGWILFRYNATSLCIVPSYKKENVIVNELQFA